MERRFFVAILLSFVVLYAYQALFVPPPAKSPQPAGSLSPAEAATEPTTAESSSTKNAETPQAVIEAAPVEGEEREREIVVDTSTVQVVLTNRGGRVLHWRLKGFRDQSGNLVDLVPANVPADQPRPFSLTVDDPSLSQRLNSALYRVSGETDGHVDATKQAAQIVFEFQGADGLHVRKEFSFAPTNYVVTFSATATDGTQALQPAIAWGPALGDAGAIAAGGSFFTGNYMQPPEAIFHRDGDVERVLADSLARTGLPEGQFRFAGVDDHYFIAAAIDPGQARLQFQPLTLPGPGDAKRQLLGHTIHRAQPIQGVRFFVGPKQFDVLQPVDPEFTKAINFGMFRVLSVPLLNALKWVHSYIGNWGWSIIVLTILINFAIAPLRHKSVVSMRKMQALQPQLKAIQDHYAGLKVTDPAQAEDEHGDHESLPREGREPRERMRADAAHDADSLRVLLVCFRRPSSFEAPSSDSGSRILSEHDPYYVTPVLMALTMFWQQKITPSTADPAQQKIMMMMPLMFGVMFLWVPSGLVLYWFVGNLWAIGQQYFTNWMIGPPVVSTARPPAERRMKNAGAGRTAAAERKS